MAFVSVNDILDSGYGDLALKSTIVAPTLVSRRPEQVLPNGKGYQGIFRLPTAPTARERTDQNADITVETVNEGSVLVPMNKNFYAALNVTDEEHLFNLDNTMEQIVMPMMDSVTAKMETYFVEQIVKGFARYVSGTQGTNPSTLAHLSAAEKLVFDNKGAVNGLVGIINSTAYSSLTQVNQNISSDFQGDAAYTALRENRLNALAGVRAFRSHGASAALNRGDIAGTTLVDGVQVAGSTVTIDGLTAATGTIKKGTRLILATSGGGVVFTVTADTLIASNAATLPIFPARTASTVDNEVVTFQTAVSSCAIFNPRGVVGGVIAGSGMPNSIVLNAGPIQLRLVDIPQGLNLKRTWALIGYAGCEVIRPEFGAICQG